MTRKAKIRLVGCSAVVVLLFVFWCLVVVASNGTLGNNAYINLFQVRSAFQDATSDDFRQAQIEIPDTPRELSAVELTRFLSRKAQSAHPADPWGGALQVTIWKRASGKGSFCTGRVTSCVAKNLWGRDIRSTEEF
jgi:cell division protein FtsX